MRIFDAAIIGAGIVGAACAADLASNGLKVALIEGSGLASGTTAAGMGHIVAMDDSEAQFTLTNLSAQLWREMSSELLANCEYENCGTIWVAADEDEMQEVVRKKSYYGEHGIETDILDEQALRAAEPQLRPGLAGGLLVRSDSVVYQLSATGFLAKIAVESGASARLCTQLKIKPKKGHLVITDRYPGFVRHQLVELGYLKSAHGADLDSVAFNIQPRSTGQILLGSSRQVGDGSRKIDGSILRRMTSRAFEYMPGLKKLSAIRVWTGVRPATPDNLPYIGRLTKQSNVIAATGHEGLGITASLGTAKIVTADVMGIQSPIPASPYSPGRAFPEH
jgi:glycine/D-amino acid oxidase-like deaminating enzyme